jgi:uncharacterized protein
MFNEHGYTNPVSNLLSRVYAWMSGGLLITAGVAYYIAKTPGMIKLFYGNPWILFGLIFLQFAFVIALSVGIRRMSFAAAAATFLGYSILNGITLSSIFLVYTQASIALTFIVAAGMFLSMAAYGYFTKADLSAMGSILLMALFGLIISGFANMFFQSSVFSYFLSGAGVVIFSLLTAYDMQKLKALSYQESGEALSKVSIIGALMLYLDFINLFLYLLRFMGQKKD